VLEASLGRDWRASLGAGKSRDEIDSTYFNSPSFASPAGLNFMTDDLIAANVQSDLAQLVLPPTATRGVNTGSEADLGFSGPLFALPGGRTRLAFGVEWRKEALRSMAVGNAPSQFTGTDFNLSMPQGPFDGGVSRTQRSGYAELLLPFVSARNAMTGVRELSLSGGARYDAYSTFGSDVTWSAGLVWKPIDPVRLRINRSTSFVAPTPREGLTETWYRDMAALAPGEPGYPTDIVDANGQPTGNFVYFDTYIYYGNPDLTAETASSWSAGVEFSPPLLPGLTLSASWHETDYQDRIIGAPTPQFIAGTDWLATYPNLSVNPATGNLIQDLRAINAARMETAGIDYQARYDLDSRYGQFIVTANLGYTDKYLQQSFASVPAVNRVGNVSGLTYTVIPRYRYATNLGWYRGGLALNLDVSAASRVSSFSATSRRTNTAPTLTNLTFGYDLEQSARNASVPAWLQDSAVTIKVLNVLNDQPESEVLNLTNGEVESYYYNAHFANPRGRMFHVNLTRRF
jgi:outer membrane receptor protein involved in Fe transport